MQHRRVAAVSQALKVLMDSLEHDYSACTNATQDIRRPSSIEAMDEKIEAHEDLRDQFLSAVTKLVADLKGRRNAVVPFARLPIELQAQIFLEAVVDLDGIRLFRRVILLSGISCSWRAVILGTPRLWTYAPVHRPKLLFLALDRSKSAPLEIEFASSSRSGGTEEAMAVVAEHKDRWGSLRWRGVYVAKLLDELLPPLPLLETLHITHITRSGEQDLKLQLGGGPRLKELQLHSTIPRNLDCIDVTNLTKLTMGLSSPNAEEITEFLQTCHALEDLKLERLGFRHPRPNNPITIILPQLQRLEVSECEETLVEILVSAIEAESLATFYAHGSDTELTFLTALRRRYDKPKSLPATAIRNAAPDRVEIRWGGSDMVISAYTGADLVLQLDFNEVTWDQVMEGILEFFPAGRINIPIDLVLDDYSSNFSAIRLDQLPNIVKISIGDDIDDEQGLETFLLRFAQPQCVDDGVMRWPASNLAHICLKNLSALGDHARSAIALLARQRGRSGALTRTNEEDWDGIEPPAVVLEIQTSCDF